MEEGAVDGDFVQGALGLAVYRFGVGARAVPEVGDAVPLLPGAAVDEVCCWVEGCEAAAVEPSIFVSDIHEYHFQLGFFLVWRVLHEPGEAGFTIEYPPCSSPRSRRIDQISLRCLP